LNIWDSLREIGVPIAAIIVQSVITWYKVQEHENRISKMETTLRGDNGGSDGVLTRLRLLERNCVMTHGGKEE
jgi:hypothetical protein